MKAETSRTSTKKAAEKNLGPESYRPLGEAPHFLLKKENADILVLGTAHISARSVKDVETAIEKFKPDHICVELCKPRYQNILDPDRWKNLDLAQVIREKKLGLLGSSLILSSFQKKIGESTGVRPGEEMMKAMDLARKNNTGLVLADREIRLTLSRAWSRVGFFSRMWLASNLFSSLLIREDIDEEQIEKMKSDDVLSDLFSQLPRRYDTVKEVIINERDQYLAENIVRTEEGRADIMYPTDVSTDTPAVKKKSGRKKKKKILAVVGAGHLEGIKKTLSSQIRHDLEKLNEVPKKRPIKAILSWVLFSLAIVGIGFFLSQGGEDAARDALVAYVLGRSIGAGLGAIIAGASFLTVLTTVVMAPISPFIPGSRLWMFSALAELRVKKPRVEDFENIATDTEDLRGILRSFYNNRVLQLFWIIILVSTGLTLGNLPVLRTIVNVFTGG